MPSNAEIVKNNNPSLVANFAGEKADGTDLAIRFFQFKSGDNKEAIDAIAVDMFGQHMAQLYNLK